MNNKFRSYELKGPNYFDTLQSSHAIWDAIKVNPRLYKSEQRPRPKHYPNNHHLNKTPHRMLGITHTVARTCLKFHVLCTFKFLISGTLHLQSTTSGVSLSGLGGQTPIAGASSSCVHRASIGELDGTFQLHQCPCPTRAPRSPSAPRSASPTAQVVSTTT
jgi:hypothetical protein